MSALKTHKHTNTHIHVSSLSCVTSKLLTKKRSWRQYRSRQHYLSFQWHVPLPLAFVLAVLLCLPELCTTGPSAAREPSPCQFQPVHPLILTARLYALQPPPRLIGNELISLDLHLFAQSALPGREPCCDRSDL